MTPALLLVASLASSAAPPLGAALEGLDAPFPVEFMPAVVEGEDVRIAYFDVPPEAPANGRVVLLFHGKNFWGDSFAPLAHTLAGKGFRVIIPDQLGFGRSSKPDIHYSFELLSKLTRAVLERANVREVALLGHSMGGMLAVRFTLMYPDVVKKLVLEDPIGLEDYRVKVPYRTVDEWYQNQLSLTEEGLRTFYKAYFAHWDEAYDVWPEAVFRQLEGAEGPRVARASALTYEMIYTQPVVQDLPRLAVPTLVVVGLADRTAVGKASVPKAVAATLGDYPTLGRRAAKAIPGARLVEIEGVGHVPHFEARERFEAELLRFLSP
jgi:pimeloyl-ACP methyl ester carboxylesterase